MTTPEIANDPVEYGTVYWTGLVSSIDTDADEDDEPDRSPVEGVILFKPSVPALAVGDSTPPYTLLLMNRQVQLLDGQISEEGRNYIKLEAAGPGVDPPEFHWTASFTLAYRGTVLRVPEVKFTLEPDQNVDLTYLIAQG